MLWCWLIGGPLWCKSRNMQNSPFQQKCPNFWTNDYTLILFEIKNVWNYSEFKDSKICNKKSCVRETLNLLTNVDSITINRKFFQIFYFVFEGDSNIIHIHNISQTLDQPWFTSSLKKIHSLAGELLHVVLFWHIHKAFFKVHCYNTVVCEELAIKCSMY